MRAQLLILPVVFCCTAALAEAPPLRFAVSDSSSMPMVALRDGQPRDGILFDLYQRIAEKMGRTPSYVVMSRTRTQPLLAEEQVDTNCYMNPAWLSKDDESYLWSRPFMTVNTVLVARSASSTIKFARLEGERIGAVLGFQYPEAEPYFRQGRLLRDNARTETQVLEKLEAGRYRYAITTDAAEAWFNKSRPARRQVHVIETLAEFPVHCVVRKAPDEQASEILDVIEQMQHDGELEAIQAKYR